MLVKTSVRCQAQGAPPFSISVHDFQRVWVPRCEWKVVCLVCHITVVAERCHIARYTQGILNGRNTLTCDFFLEQNIKLHQLLYSCGSVTQFFFLQPDVVWAILIIKYNSSGYLKLFLLQNNWMLAKHLKNICLVVFLTNQLYELAEYLKSTCPCIQLYLLQIKLTPGIFICWEAIQLFCSLYSLFVTKTIG